MYPSSLTVVQDATQVLHIPRPVLITPPVAQQMYFHHQKQLYEREDSLKNEFIYDLPGLSLQRCETPTRFTLLGQSGVVSKWRSTPTTCQLSTTVCSLVLLALVAMIVYMEGE